MPDIVGGSRPEGNREDQQTKEAIAGLQASSMLAI